MNADLDRWLEYATKNLCEEARREIRQEIETHYSDALESHVAAGQPDPEARLLAMADLGDPKESNRQFRRSHLTLKEAKHFSGLLLPPKRRYVWFQFLIATLLTGSMALINRRPAMLWILGPLLIIVWAMSLVGDRLRRRLTVKAGIVFVLLAVAVTFTLLQVMMSKLSGVGFSTYAPGMIGGAIGFGLFAWKTYRPLWRKAGTRRIES